MSSLDKIHQTHFFLFVFMISEIPFEILFNIASFLTTKDKLECTTVCSGWNEAFSESLWNTISINDHKNLIRMCKETEQENNVFKENGYRVRELSLSRWLSVKGYQLEILQNHFQRIQSLHVPHGSIRITEPIIPANWRLWSSLSRLKICVSGLGLQNTPNGFLEIISELPNLEYLEYIWSGWGESHVYTLQDIEAFHSFLPRLKYLSLNIVLANLDPGSVECFDAVKPAENLKVLKTRINNMDLRWLAYFARKYPNIHTLEWTDHTDLPASDLVQEEALQMFTGLQYAFPHLKKVVVYNLSPTNLTHMGFWDLFGRFDVPLKKLEYNLGICFETAAVMEQTLSACLKSCSKTLETLYIGENVGFSEPINIPICIGICPTLVSLDLSVFPSPIAINILLNNCTMLRKLKLKTSRVFIDSNMEDIREHGLQLLHITKASASPSLFKYISECCRQLRYMRLVDTSVVGPLSPAGGNISIDMTHTHFKLLQLNHVSFYGSQDDICDNNSAVNLLAFSKANTALYDDLGRNTSSDQEYIGSITDHVWFHSYWDGEDDTYDWINECKIGYMRTLNSEEENKAQKYFGSFQSKSNQSFDQDQVKRSKNGLVIENDWEYDLPRGHATIACNQVDQYVINGNSVYKDFVWDELYSTL
ncbi:hypothetical protein CLU79DRAFT_748067 [Phycomyces nitens]|nr:hypothetical protein CLU79DRAFT_748067 [Phycomyces nitens]